MFRSVVGVPIVEFWSLKEFEVDYLELFSACPQMRTSAGEPCMEVDFKRNEGYNNISTAFLYSLSPDVA